ncbi:MAG: hypothetical protein ABIF09_05420 [Gemmatimonadota bacterium]
MFDYIAGPFSDPVGLLALTIAIVVGCILALGLLEIAFTALVSILLSYLEPRPKAPFLLGLVLPVLVFSTGPRGLSAQEGVAQDVPTIEARFTRIFSSDTMFIGNAALSPDGRWIVFDHFHEGGGDIMVVSTEGGDPIRLTTGRNMNQIPQWFPSGDRIAFLSDQVAESPGLLFYVMSIPFDPETGRATGPARQVSLEPAREPAVSPDGRWIAYGTYLGKGWLRLIPSNGGTARTLFDIENISARDPVWSSDSRHVYFVSRTRDPVRNRLMRVSTDGGEATEVSSLPSPFDAIAPDARYLVRETRDDPGQGRVLELLSRQGDVLGQVPLHRNMNADYTHGFTPNGNGTTALVRDRPAPIFVAPVAGGPVRQISEARAYESVLGWTPDNQKVFYETQLNGRDAVLLTPVEGGPTLEIPLPPDATGPIVPSADGRYLAYALGPDEEQPRTVMVRRISDGETRVLTDAFVWGLRVGSWVLGPGGGVTDGGEFLYLERHGDRLELRASLPEGPSRLIRSVAPGEGMQGRPSLGVHGDWVAYTENAGDSATLFLSIGEGERAQALVTVPGGLEVVCWSYDRRWIVSHNWVGQGQGYQVNLLLVGVTPEGNLASEPRILETETSAPIGVQWLPDNQAVALFGWVTRGSAVTKIWLFPIREGESPVSLIRNGTAGVYSASLSPDGRYLAYGKEVPRGSSIWIMDYGEFLRERGLGGR